MRAILEDLQRGRIDRGRFTVHANAYFVSAALEDYRTSLGPAREARGSDAAKRAGPRRNDAFDISSAL